MIRVIGRRDLEVRMRLWAAHGEETPPRHCGLHAHTGERALSRSAPTRPHSAARQTVRQTIRVLLCLLLQTVKFLNTGTHPVPRYVPWTSRGELPRSHLDQMAMFTRWWPMVSLCLLVLLVPCSCVLATVQRSTGHKLYCLIHNPARYIPVASCRTATHCDYIK